MNDAINCLREGINRMRAVFLEPKVIYMAHDLYKRLVDELDQIIRREDGAEYLTVDGVELRIIPSDPCGLFTWAMSADDPEPLPMPPEEEATE